MSEQIKAFAASVWFYRLFAWKIASTAVQLFLGALIAAAGSSEEPFLSLKSIAYLGALVASLRGVDALLDPTLQKLSPFKEEQKP